MAKRSVVDFDIALARAGIDRRTRKMHDKAEHLLLEIQRPLEERIRQLAPVGSRPDDEKRLREGVFAEVVVRSDGPQLRAGVLGVRHAIPVEFGTSTMPAHPFVRPAVAEFAARLKRS
jgi:hypothetical protein